MSWSSGLGIFFILIGIAVLIVSIALSSLILQSRKNIAEILKAVEDNVQDFRGITKDIDAKLEKTNRFFEILDQIGRSLKTPAAIIGRFFEALSIEIGAFLYALKKAIQAFYRN